MKKLIAVLIFIFTSNLNAQFKINGEITNYPEKDIMVRMFDGPTDILINKVKTDKSGKFSVQVPRKFSGIVRITDISRHAVLDILTDNENVDFKSKLENNAFVQVEFKQGKTAAGFQTYTSLQGLIDLKTNVFPIIKPLYNENDQFYQAILKEETRIGTLDASTELPLLKYYVTISDLANSTFDSKMSADLHKEKILKHLVNDNEYLEGSGYMFKLVLDYLRASIVGATSQEQINTTIEKEIDELLVKTDLETPRGQKVLSTIFLALPQEQFGSLLEKYYAKANALTCEITDELKSNLAAHNSTTVGNVVPNILFDKPVKGAKSLYDVKADKKIIIFWASWCPACNEEMPFVKEYYRNFKLDGGEIVSISLDFDESAYKEATKDFEWFSYSDFLQWDSKSVMDFGISSTPTLLLVDKDNKLIKKASHISELVEL